MNKVVNFRVLAATLMFAAMSFSGCKDDGGDDPDKPDNKATVTNVEVTPASPNVAKGATQQFSATVSGDNNPAQTVIWAIVETNKHAGTAISATGLLTVGADESLAKLTVRATSTVDDTKSGTAAVTVTGGSTGTEMTWTKVESPFGKSPIVTDMDIPIICVSRCNNMFVIGGGYHRIAYSTTDIKQWTVVDIAASNPLLEGFSVASIAYGNGKLVLINGSGSVAYTTENALTDWKKPLDVGEQEQPFSEYGLHRSVVYGKGASGNDRFVVYQNGKIKYSDDGGATWSATNYTEETTPFTLIRSMVWNGSKFVAIGAFQTGSGFSTVTAGVIAHSDDGATWTEVTTHPFATTMISCLVWDGKNFVAFSSTSPLVAHSGDGKNWNTVNTSYDTTPMISDFFAFGGGKYVAGYTNYVYYSDDGKIFKEGNGGKRLEPPFYGIITGIAYGDKKFVAVSSGVDNSDIGYSSDIE